MRNLAISSVLLATSLTLFGCGTRTAAPTNTAASSNANAPAPAEKPIKAVDLPALVGKPFSDIEKVLGPPAEKSGDSLTWKYPQGDLMARQDYRDKKKVGYFTFTLTAITMGDRTGSGFAKYEQLGDLVGIDVRGKTPTKAEEGQTGEVSFDNYDLNGKMVPVLKFNKVLGSFNTVWIYTEKL